MHGCSEDEGISDSTSDMIIANFVEPVTDQLEECKIRYRSLSNDDGEKLIIRENSVTIQQYPSGIIRRRLTADFNLLDAFWCMFPGASANDTPLHGVCLIGHKNLIFAPDNDWLSYTITLPFTVKRVFPSALGLILQRAAPLSSIVTPTKFPYLFSLSHPYSELLPVICKNKDSENSSHYIWDSSEVTLLEVLNESKLLLTYSTTARVHSLYCVRKATKMEWKCAASKAESVLSCNTTLTPVGRSSQISTPQLGSHSRHRFCKNDSFGDEVWSTPQTRSVRTRSMTAAAALIQSLPFPTTSPAQRSSANRSIADSPVLRLRGGSAHTTPRYTSFCDDSIISLIETRGSELDLLAPEICIECVWTERRQADPDTSAPAKNAFLTQDFIGQSYICFYVAEQKLLKCIRVKMHDEVRLTTSSFTTIHCQGAANIEGRKMMAAIDPDGVVIIYSGITRMGTLYGNYEFLNSKECEAGVQEAQQCTSASGNLSMCVPVVSLRTAFNGHLILETQKHESLICKLSTPTCSSFVTECLAQVCTNLPLDKAMKLSVCWYTGNNFRLLMFHQQNQVAAEIAMFLQFLFMQCGIFIQDFPIFREVGLLRSRCEEGVCEKKKRTENLCHTAASAWKKLKQACDKKWWSFDDIEKCAGKHYKVTVSNEGSLHQYCFAIFSGLHASYDLAKLDRRASSLLFLLASSLYAFSQIFELKSYSDHYRKDFPALSKQSFTILEGKPENQVSGRKLVQSLLTNARFSLERIPSWYDNLTRFLDASNHLTSFTSSHFFAPIVIVLAVGLKRLESIGDVQKLLGKSYDRKLHLSKMDARNFADILSENHTTIEKCEKLAKLFKFTKSSLLDLPPAVALMLCELMYENSTKTLHFLSSTTCRKDRSILPSAEENVLISRQRWKDDLRCINAMQMLDSRRPIFIPTTPEIRPDAELRETNEHLLHSVGIRTVTNSFGRSALDFRSFSPPLSRPRAVPLLNLNGRLHPANTPFELPQTEAIKAMIKWGLFYNGVAAGLCIGDSQSLHLDCEWLAMSVNNLQGPESAGLMYAFGLNGHITNMNLFLIHELLSTGDPLMSIAILLGYAVSRRTTGDIQMYKMMVTHLPFMMGPTLLELHIDTMIQTAALVALGLLFAQSSHLGILSQLANEIGKPASPDREPATDRYSYSLSAGFAIGLIALGRGEDLMTSVPFVEQYPPLASRLIVLMEGGLRSLCVFPVTASTDTPPLGQATTSAPQQSNHVRETENVNPHLTANAATVALGLMYLKTENRWAAESLKIPETLSAIEEIRPDLVLLRTFCRHLILWNGITAAKQWVESSVPSTVLRYKERLFGGEKANDFIDSRIIRVAVDRQTIAQTYLCAIAGSCFAMAVRFASTWNAEAFKTIMHYTLMVLPEPKQDECAKQLCLAAGNSVRFSVLNTLINSLGILMAGSGNLQVLRLCRLLRSRVTILDAFRYYSEHSIFVSVNTTIGMLMLGRGRYALKTDDLSIASLVISFFPISPHAISDNRTYLQPLRFLWVIAAEERLLCSIDMDSEDLVELDVEVKFKVSSVTFPDVLHLRTPCIIPELTLLDKVQISGQEYEKRIFNLRNESSKEQLEEILRKQHGRLMVNYLGQKEPKIAVGALNRLCNIESDPLFKPVRDKDLLRVTQLDQEIRERFSFDMPEETSSFSVDGLPRKFDVTAFDSWIRRFQLDKGSIAAHDYALTFLKDVLTVNPVRFGSSQYNILNAFLDRSLDTNDEWPTHSNIIPSELVASLL